MKISIQYSNQNVVVGIIEMKNNITILGYGAGISKSIAHRFGSEEFILCLVARNKNKLNQAVLELQEKGVEAYAFQYDLSDIEIIPKLIEEIKLKIGDVKNILWNAFSDSKGDLLNISPSVLTKDVHLRVSSYIATVQACLPDLEANSGSILSTNGIFALDIKSTDSIARPYASLTIAAAAQYKTTNLLIQSLVKSNVFVGQVIVNGFVDDTSCDQNQNYTVHPDQVAQEFWKMFLSKSHNSAICGQLVPHEQIEI